ncbi:MAG: S41 family peptidase, partial [Bacteroidota bacterium]
VQYTGPIVILTSDFTASAAEVFLLLVKDLPNVTIIGDNTEGIFSDMYEFKLPNKWQVSLSHQQYLSKDKMNYEGIGIAPDILIVNRREDLEGRYDPVLKEAINYLRNKLIVDKKRGVRGIVLVYTSHSSFFTLVYLL